MSDDADTNERAFLVGDIAALEALLADLPPTFRVERASFESRLTEQRTRLILALSRTLAGTERERDRLLADSGTGESLAVRLARWRREKDEAWAAFHAARRRATQLHRRAQAAERATRVAQGATRDVRRNAAFWGGRLSDVRERRLAERDDARTLAASALAEGLAECERLRAEAALTYVAAYVTDPDAARERDVVRAQLAAMRDAACVVVETAAAIRYFGSAASGPVTIEWTRALLALGETHAAACDVLARKSEGT